MSSLQWSLTCLSLVTSLFVTSSLYGESELDPVQQAPKFILQKLDSETNTITSYQVSHLDTSLRPENLRGLSQEQRQAKLDAFVRSVETGENELEKETVEPIKVTSELDRETSTSACYWRAYGSRRYSRRYYGAAFYGSYGGVRYRYRPCWGYGAYYRNGFQQAVPSFQGNPGYLGDGNYPASGYADSGNQYGGSSYTLYGY